MTGKEEENSQKRPHQIVTNFHIVQSLFSKMKILQALGSNQRNYAEIQITIEPEFSVIAQLKVIFIIKMIVTKITMM